VSKRLWLTLLLLVSACQRDDQGLAVAAKTAPPPAVPVMPRSPSPPERVDLTSELARCEVHHHGQLFDFGAQPLAQRGFAPPRPDPPTILDRGSDTFERIETRDVKIDFWLDEAPQNLWVTVRLHPVSAKWLLVAIDDKRVGQQRLTPGETRNVELGPLTMPLTQGRHSLHLKLGGAPRGSKLPLIDLDWVRIGPRLEPGHHYSAPTLADLVSDVVLDGIPKRSITLRAPGKVRCFIKPAADAELRAGLGFWGEGRGAAEVALLSDHHPPRILATRKLTGGDGSSFVPLVLDLAAADGDVIGLELRATEGARAGRVVFGDPAITRKLPVLPRVPGAQTVVIVILSSVDRARLPPWGSTGALSALAELARQATVFSAHRAPSSVPAASVASLLSGLPPAGHGLQSSTDRLRAGVATIAELVKEAGGRTAFFTGVPTTFAPFGLKAGFDTFESFSPVHDVPATEPLTRAAAFLERELSRGSGGRRLVVAQLRGGHPPWDLTREETAALKPAEYAGILDPRRGGIVLAALRDKPRRTARRIGDDDWLRLRALHDAALAKQDAALGKLITVLKQREAWRDALVIVTSDVGLGAGPEIPFDPAAGLTEDRLVIPLLVKFPGGALAGREVSLPSSAVDVATTVLAALGLDAPSQGGGADLFARGSGHAALLGSADVAVVGSTYSARLGGWLLSGKEGEVPRLCMADVDPACATDVMDQKTIAARTLWLSLFQRDAQALRAEALAGPAERAELDPETTAALTVWGDLR
jgi:hypothetical protein